MDFVIAWVDGADPAHAQARRQYKVGTENAHAGVGYPSRFRDNGEIYFLIASILKYAPFVERVHIVTDNQRPKHLESFAEAGLCAPSFLKVVSHDTIFSGLDATRPTFNPRAFEAALWRIPGLSEHFIYSNDDMFLNAPLTPDFFFRDGRPVLHGDLVKPERKLLKNRLRHVLHMFEGKPASTPRHRTAQEKAAVLAGMSDRFFLADHHPHPVRRSTMERFYSDHPEALALQLRYRYRNIAQHNPIALANNLEIGVYGTEVRPPFAVAYFRPKMTRSPVSILAAMRDESLAFGCVQSFDKLEEDLQGRINATLLAKFEDVLPLAVRRMFEPTTAVLEHQPQPA